MIGKKERCCRICCMGFLKTLMGYHIKTTQYIKKSPQIRMRSSIVFRWYYLRSSCSRCLQGFSCKKPSITRWIFGMYTVLDLYYADLVLDTLLPDLGAVKEEVTEINVLLRFLRYPESGEANSCRFHSFHMRG